MTLMMKQRALRLLIICAIAAITSAPGAYAQYDQTIEVEGKYVPEVIPRERVALFPPQQKFRFSAAPLPFSETGVHANFHPQAIPMPATGWRTSRSYDTSRGYADLSLGSFLNATLSAGYRIIDSEATTLGVRLQHNSTSLFHPRLGEAVRDVRRHLYDESLALYASHDFAGKGRLDATLQYHLSLFNYYGFNPAQAAPDASLKAPTQTLNDFSARFEWNSPAVIDNISYRAALGARYFGYRALPLPDGGAIRATRETNVFLDASFAFPTSRSSSAGIDLDGDLLCYANGKSYGMLSLTPFYRFARQSLNIRIGARIDLAFNAGTSLFSEIPSRRYSTFHIAPSVSAEYAAGPASLYVRLLGGSTLHTLASLSELDFYGMPALLSTRPVYAPLDGSLGATFGPFHGFSAGLDFAYRIARDQFTGGWFMPWLNGDLSLTANPATTSDGNAATSPLDTYNIHGFSLGLNLAYNPASWLNLSVEGRYQPQNGKKGYFNGFDRPRWTLKARAESNPWRTLRFGIDWQMRAVRSIIGVRLPDISLLGANVAYSFTPRLSVWLRGDNLLNRRDPAMLSLPMQGISFAIGAGINF